MSEDGSSSTDRKKPMWHWMVPALSCVLVWTLLGGTTGQQRAVAAIFALTVALWVTELMPLAITALLSTALLVVFAQVDEKVAFGSYGDPTILLFIGSFLLAKAMEVTKLDERLAWWVLSKGWATKSASALLLTCGLFSCVISLFVSNTATAAMLLPIIAKVLDAMKLARTAFATAMLLMLTWGASVAVGFPVGTPPNLIGMQQIQAATGHRISFVEWMIFAMPLTVVMALGAWLLLRQLDRRQLPDVSPIKHIAAERLGALAPLATSERIVMGCFTLALILWITPDALSAISQISRVETPPAATFLQKHLTPTISALLAAALLFIIPAKDRASGHVMTWREAVKIDWGIILLFGGGIALGQAMFSSGLAKTLGEFAASATGANSVWAITALCIAAAILLSELASNTAAATSIIPVAIGLAMGAEVSPIPPALGAALGASFGFMLPVSTPPNAIVYSSGQVTASQMIRRGFLIDILGFVATFLSLRIFLPLLGLDR
jgi:solute carrier family 13 (sodium-dependent dicarboxylate transporter), member 2/3/5